MHRWLVWLSVIGCGDPVEDLRQSECPKFSTWVNESAKRAADTVPDAERQAAQTPGEIAAWYRRLAVGYEAEAKLPAQFTHPDLGPMETRYKAHLQTSADLLRKQADAWESGQTDAIAPLQLQDADNNSARGKIGADEWLKVCKGT